MSLYAKNYKCSCGNTSLSRTKDFDDHHGYEALVCKCCARFIDHKGEHKPNQWSRDFVQVGTKAVKLAIARVAKPARLQIDTKIAEANSMKHKAAGQSKPAVFIAETYDKNGAKKTNYVGWHFVKDNVVSGDRGHFDHGAGVEQNTDLIYIWKAN